MSNALIEVKNLEVSFHLKNKTVKAVDNVSFTVAEGEIFALLGESGCGKTTTAMSLIRLVEEPGHITGGEIIFEGEDLLKLSDNDMSDTRGNGIGMIFQNPLDSLNPVYSIGYQIAEGLQKDDYSKTSIWEKAVKSLGDVKIADPESRAKSFPHEISGGMRQRVMISMMLSRNPKLLIADEPTTALDVTIQAQILELLKDIRNQYNTAIILITHDFGIVAEMADRVGVMYAGNLVEIGDVFQIFENPTHPYTRLLINALPRITKAEGKLQTIPGCVPDLTNMPEGCKFRERCPNACEACSVASMSLVEVEPGHYCACPLEVK